VFDEVPAGLFDRQSIAPRFQTAYGAADPSCPPCVVSQQNLTTPAIQYPNVVIPVETGIQMGTR